MPLPYPIGSIVTYAGPDSSKQTLFDSGLILCDGRKLSKTDTEFAALFHAIGTAYGSTSTEFYIPDCQGRFIRGTDNGRGLDPDASARKASNSGGNTGDKVGSIQECSIEKHVHSYTMCSDFHRVNYGSLIGPGVYQEGNWETTDCEKFGGDETRPRNAYIYFYIVFKNA